jgi:phenylacetate-CoA ligase
VPSAVRHPREWRRLAQLGAGELRSLQDRLLARYVREELYPFSRHYRRVFDEAGIDPRSIRGRDDLRRVPFTTKQDLLAAQSDPERRYDFVLRPTPAALKEHWSFPRKLALVLGGARAREALRFAYTPHFLTFTTGRSTEPVAFTYTPHDLDTLGEATARLFDVARVDRPDDRVLNLFPFAPHLAFWAVTLGGFTAGRMVMPSGGGKVMGTEGNLRMIERFKPTALVGTPGFVYHLLRAADARGADLSSVRSVTLGAEKAPPALKLKILEALQRRGAGEVIVSATYGFTEARLAFAECPAKPQDSPGYHLFPDLGLFEVVDPASGEPAGEGQDGELVYTPLSGHGTVVFRYRTGDLAVGGITWEPCPWCGRTLPRVSSTLRRASERHALDFTKIKGTLVDLSAMGSLLADMPEVEEWQVVLRKKDDDPHELDELEVRFAVRAGGDAQRTAQAIRTRIATATEVTPNQVSAHSLEEMLELLGMETQMKEKRFLDLRPR